MHRDVGTLVNLIHNYSDKWNFIGLKLGFVQPELNLIYNNPSLFVSAPVSYLNNLLNQWVQWPTKVHPTRPTLRALCEALCSSLVGLGSLAEEVKRELSCSTAVGKGSHVCTLLEAAVMSDHKICMTTNYPVYDG